jgi:hypothetical protein
VYQVPRVSPPVRRQRTGHSLCDLGVARHVARLAPIGGRVKLPPIGKLARCARLPVRAPLHEDGGRDGGDVARAILVVLLTCAALVLVVALDNGALAGAARCVGDVREVVRREEGRWRRPVREWSPHQPHVTKSHLRKEGEEECTGLQVWPRWCGCVAHRWCGCMAQVAQASGAGGAGEWCFLLYLYGSTPGAQTIWSTLLWLPADHPWVVLIRVPRKEYADSGGSADVRAAAAHRVPDSDLPWSAACFSSSSLAVLATSASSSLPASRVADSLGTVRADLRKVRFWGRTAGECTCLREDFSLTSGH